MKTEILKALINAQNKTLPVHIIEISIFLPIKPSNKCEKSNDSGGAED